MKILPLKLLILSFAALATFVHAADNLIPNGDFETENEKGMAAGWNGIIDEKKNPQDLYIKDGQPGETVHGGTHGIKLYVSSFGSAGQDTKRRNVLETIRSFNQATEPPIKLEPGKTYKLSFWIKRDGFNDPAHNMVVEVTGFPFPEPGTTRHSLSVTKMAGPSDWERQEAVFLVPPDTDIAEGYVIFRLFFPSGTLSDNDRSVAYIDDVHLTQED